MLDTCWLKMILHWQAIVLNIFPWMKQGRFFAKAAEFLP